MKRGSRTYQSWHSSLTAIGYISRHQGRQSLIRERRLSSHIAPLVQNLAISYHCGCFDSNNQDLHSIAYRGSELLVATAPLCGYHGFLALVSRELSRPASGILVGSWEAPIETRLHVPNLDQVWTARPCGSLRKKQGEYQGSGVYPKGVV